MRDQRRPLVVDLAGVDHHPHLAARLHRVDLLHPGVARGERLEVAQPRHVVLERVATSAGPGAREGVGRLHDHRLDRAWLDLVVMGLDRVGDGLALAVAAGQAGADQRMGALHLVVDRLADVVQQRRPPGDLGGARPARRAISAAR